MLFIFSELNPLLCKPTDFIERELPDTDEKDEILKFIKASKRGILKLSAKEITDEN